MTKENDWKEGTLRRILQTNKEEELRKRAEQAEANHADMVNRNRILLQRPDLPVDRIPAHSELVRLQGENTTLKSNIKELATIIGECLEAAGIVKGFSLTGPELLHFGNDLKQFCGKYKG